ncbi:hypothetical protein Tco_0632562 [Tanacetum coccineum]
MHNPNHTITQDNFNRDLILRRRVERSLNNNSFLGEYECSSLALDKEERKDEKKRLDHLKQDQTMMVVKEIEDGLLEEMEKFGWWFEQDIDGENDDDNEKKLVMLNEEGWMS